MRVKLIPLHQDLYKITFQDEWMYAYHEHENDEHLWFCDRVEGWTKGNPFHFYIKAVGE